MPMSSAAYTGTGEYFVRFRVGTPAREFLLVADTGSDLTWVNCKYRPTFKKARKRSVVSGRSSSRRRRVFRAYKSRSFHPIGCSSEMCKSVLPFSLTTCPTPATPCAYDYGYADGSSAQGFFARESATITLSNTKRSKLKGLVVGCTSSISGASFRQSDGVLGLGYSSTSFASRATAHFGGKFSYCLVDHLSPKNTSSYLTFGFNPAFISNNSSSSSNLIIQSRLEPFYAISLTGISVDGQILKIPSSVWDINKRGGAILDSGASLTILAEPAYKEVTSALSRQLKGIPMVDDPTFEYCYNWTLVEDSFEFPKLVFHFNGSARLEPPPKSYIIDDENGVKCIGLQSSAWPSSSIIGNIIQQEHLWEFDIKNRMLRFQPSKCAL